MSNKKAVSFSAPFEISHERRRREERRVGEDKAKRKGVESDLP